ncbi:MAG: PAS domain S-box protein [Spirochaetales bacterium]|nr:PAS domain S-box protein [Spirochaetales bacterium]
MNDPNGDYDGKQLGHACVSSSSWDYTEGKMCADRNFESNRRGGEERVAERRENDMKGRIAVLEIESSSLAAAGIERALKEAGFAAECRRVATGKALAASLAERAFDIVLAADTVPRLLLPQALKTVKAAGFGAPVIAVLSSASPRASVAALKAGADDVVLRDELDLLGPAIKRELMKARRRRDRRPKPDSLNRVDEPFRALFDYAGDAAVITGLSGSILAANDLACSRLGYQCRELIGKSILDIDREESPSGLERKLKIIRNARKPGHPVSERVHTGKNGVRLPVAVSLHAVEYGGQAAVLHLARDLSQRRWAEDVFRESEERFRRLFQYVGAGMVLVATDFRFLKANDMFCRMLGYEEEDLVRHTFQEVTHPDDQSVGAELSRQMLEGEREAFQIEKRYLRRDGSVVWGLVSSTLLRDAHGSPLYFLTLIQDITERKQAEEALRVSEERYRFTMEAISVGLWDWDVESGRVYYSPSFLAILGERELPPAFSAWDSRIHPDDREAFRHTLRDHLEGLTDDWACDHRLRAQEGEWLWVVGRGRVVSRDSDGRSRRMVGTLVDISVRKLAEQRLIERESDLRKLSARLIKVREEERNRIARNIHDDLGHAVMNIKMNLFLADMMLTGGKESVRAFLHEMKDQVDSLLEMMQYISMEIRPAVLYDLGLAEALRFYVKRFSEQTKIPCRVRSLPDIPNLPDETAITIYRIVQEVFVNMFRHSGCTEIALDLRLSNGRAVLSVADNGKGITREEIGSIDSIGIMGMRERALSLGGELAIEGVPGGGTTVTLAFPLPSGEDS